MKRYAVIDVDDDGTEYLAYIVPDLNAAEDLLDEGGKIWEIKVPRGEGEYHFRTRDGVPTEDDGRPEVGKAMADALRPFVVEVVEA